MSQLISDIKSYFLKYWFYASALALAILYYLVDSRGKELAQLNEEVQRMKLGQELTAINQQANQSQEGFENAKKSYEQLVGIHSDLLTRLGISHTNPGSANSADTTQPPGNSTSH
jgi:hypothetical protein